MDPINDSTSPAFFRWDPACWLRATGPDAFTFLQGQFTNDLRALEHAPAVYGLWLNVKGKVVADSFVLRGPAPDEFWICSYGSPVATVRERLESHLIADDVTLEDVTAEGAGISLLGAAEALPPPPEGARVFPGRRIRSANTEWLLPRGSAAEAVSRLGGATELDASALERARIAAGIPAVPRDLGPADLPNEAGLETEALSYAKGCYLGQEVMARLKSMGQVRRRLRRVAGPGAPPATPAPLFLAARAVGELRSAAPDGQGGWIGLAMLSLLALGAAAAVAAQPDGAPGIQILDTP